MDETPPRRSRRPPPPPQRSALPLVPILIGVIVLGFIIGAGLSLAGRRGGGDRTVVANATAKPAPRSATTPAPVTPASTDRPPTDPPRATPPANVAATRRVSPAPTPKVTPVATDSPVPTPRATVVRPAKPPVTNVAETKAPAPAVPRTPIATSQPTSQITSQITSQSTSQPTPKPTPKPTIKAVAVATATPLADAPASSDDADSEFAKLASAVVRQYVSAIERGDDATAYAAFGPGAAGNVKLIESGVIDGSTRIQHVEARGAGNNATVNVDLRTTKGLYFGQYTVHRTESGAALIIDHALNKL